jgi:geranylgeranyl diphosphate synthase, type I
MTQVTPHDNSFLQSAKIAREHIITALEAFLSGQEELGSIHPVATDFIDRTIEYSSRGKTVRGVLAARGYAWFGGADLTQASYQIGAAIELLNGAFLIHDDIIDQDDVRRGRPSMHRLLEQYAKDHGWANPVHTGKSLAIIVGDMCFFWLQQLISELECPAEIKVSLLSTFAKESLNTGIGEAADVISSIEPLSAVTAQEIEVVNKYKTARYTVSLPLLLAAQLAEVPKHFLNDIGYFGDLVGSVFQLRDDELSLFGLAEEIGKPVGSDIREGKRTVWWCELMERCSESEKEKLIPLSGKQDLTMEEIEWIRELVVSSGTDAAIKQRIAKLKTEALELMGKLPIIDSCKTELEEAVAYIIDRRK